MYSQTADRRAFSLIMRKGVKKDDIVRFSLSLNDKENEEVTNTFHRQGPRLWGFWCKAMTERKKAGLVVPSVFA
jgi:hypothetical protein